MLEYQGKRVGVTGAAGFIGRQLVPLLRKHRATVQAWDRLDAAGVDERVDLADGDAVKRAFDAFKPEIVFHLAAVGVSHDRAHDPRVIGENVASLSHLMDALESGAEAGRPVLVTTGTMAEYGAAPSPIVETAACRPTTAYAISKFVCSRLLQQYASTKGIDAIVARLFHVYGPNESEGRLFPTLLDQLPAGVPVALSDGLQSRDFVHLDDVCEGMCRLALTPQAFGQVVNVGTGRALTIREVAERVATLLGADHALLRFGSRERSPGDEDFLEADVTRLHRLLSWVPPQRFLGAEKISDVL